MKKKVKNRAVIPAVVFLAALLSIPFVIAQEIPKDTTKAVILHFNIKDDKITYLDSKIIYNYPPDLHMQWRAFKVRMLSTDGTLIKQYSIEDPRCSRVLDIQDLKEGEPSVICKDHANFTITLPFYENFKTVRIHEYSTDELLVSVDLSRQIYDFCSKFSYDDPDCRLLDLDNDGVKDPDDNSPLIPNPGQEDSDDDGAGDVSDNCPGKYNPDQKDSNNNGVGDACEGGIPWWAVILVVLIMILVLLLRRKPRYWKLMVIVIIIVIIILLLMILRMLSGS